jgi:hypothetical protein
MSEYYSIITDAGAALEAAAAAGGPPVALTYFAVGDGGGVPVIPSPAQVALVNEVYRSNLSSLGIGEQPNVLVAQGIIPMESGGYTVREVGIFTQDGILYSVSNYPDQVKPAPDSGYAAKLGIEYLLQVSSAADITLIISPQDYLTEERANTLYIPLAGSSAITGVLRSVEEFQTNGTRGFRMANGQYGAFWHHDGIGMLYLMLTSAGDPFGNWNDLRPFIVDLVTGHVTMADLSVNGGFSAGENIQAGFGVYESGGAVRVYSPNNPPPAPPVTDLSPYYTGAQCDARYVQGVQLGAEVWADYGGGSAVKAPAGHVLIGLQEQQDDNEIHGYWFKPEQQNINGVWTNVAG